MSATEHAIPEYQPPGARLREVRERAGISLEQIAKRTMIPVSRLRALELDDYARVGGATFVTGYTRTYARALGVDPEPLVKSLQDALPDPAAPPAEAPAIALALEVQKRPKSIFWPVMIVLACLLVVVALIGISTGGLVGTPPSQTVAVEPAEQEDVNEFGERSSVPLIINTEDLHGTEDLDGTGDLDGGTIESTGEADAADEGNADGTEDVREGSPEILGDGDFATTGPAPAVEPATPAPLDSAVASGPRAELAMTFRGECWVDVTDATGKRIVARLATSSDNLRLFGQPPFDITLGNAAVVDMTLNGEPVDTAPPAGRKMLRLTVGQ